jgi:three-Cys-motif partner protein
MVDVRQDLVARTSGHWSREKLYLLEQYAPAFVRACTSAEGGCFIDAFAGPGWNVEKGTGQRFEGSPQIVSRYGFREIYLIDRNKEHTNALQALRLGPNVHIMTGDANTLVPEVLDRIPDWLPVLTFLDQNANEVSWDTLQKLAERSADRKKKPEILILLPTGMALQRFFERDGVSRNAHVLTKVFGSEDVWRPIEAERLAGGLRGARLIQALTEAYVDSLRRLGYAERPLFRHVRTDGESGRILYTLVFATDHPVGRRIMEKCFNNRFSGQQSFF